MGNGSAVGNAGFGRVLRLKLGPSFTVSIRPFHLIYVIQVRVVTSGYQIGLLSELVHEKLSGVVLCRYYFRKDVISEVSTIPSVQRLRLSKNLQPDEAYFLIFCSSLFNWPVQYTPDQIVNPISPFFPSSLF